MRFLRKATGLYRKARWLMWLGGVIVSVLTPLLGYGMHFLNVLKDKRQLETDNPELASEETPGTLFGWLSNADMGRIIGVLALLGILFMVGLIVLQVVASGKKDKADSEEDGDMGGEVAEEDMDFQTPSGQEPPTGKKKNPAPAEEDGDGDWYID